MVSISQYGAVGPIFGPANKIANPSLYGQQQSSPIIGRGPCACPGPEDISDGKFYCRRCSSRQLSYQFCFRGILQTYRHCLKFSLVCVRFWTSLRFWFFCSGYSRKDCLGRNCKFLQGKDTDQLVVRAIGAVIWNTQNFVLALRLS